MNLEKVPMAHWKPYLLDNQLAEVESIWKLIPDDFKTELPIKVLKNIDRKFREHEYFAKDEITQVQEILKVYMELQLDKDAFLKKILSSLKGYKLLTTISIFPEDDIKEIVVVNFSDEFKVFRKQRRFYMIKKELAESITQTVKDNIDCFY